MAYPRVREFIGCYESRALNAATPAAKSRNTVESAEGPARAAASAGAAAAPRARRARGR